MLVHYFSYQSLRYQPVGVECIPLVHIELRIRGGRHTSRNGLAQQELGSISDFSKKVQQAIPLQIPTFLDCSFESQDMIPWD